MTYQDKNAPNALRSYVWKLLDANLGWSRNDYGGLTPIIPLAQQPELMQTARPFLVYGSARHPSGELYRLIKESISYTVYTPSVNGVASLDENNRIIGLLAETFSRQDEAAKDVNDWLFTEGRNRGVYFGSVRTALVERAEPADEEGGYVAGLIMLDCVYTSDDNTIITRGFNV